jgi:CheY-like chemotaxis protein
MTKIKKLALVDDDEIFTFLSTKIIQQTQLVNEIITFGNGLDFLDYLKANLSNNEFLPEIILLDLSMPILNGWQVLDEYALLQDQIDKKMDIYICSSSISPSDVDKASNIKEIKDYLIKPITIDRMIEIVSQY